ncbi:hypothetical protein EON66_08205 [archaeon]|nr:MAG: hypothetical protein EON66_08205 [archaeon]
MKLWDAAAGRVRHTLAKHTAMVYSAAFSPDGELLVSGSSDRNVFVWSTRDGSLLRTFTAPGGVFEVNFDSTGDRVVACCSNSTVAVIDLRV